MRIALLCDDGLLLDGLKCLLATLPACQVVASESSWDRLEARSRKNAFDVLVLASNAGSKEATLIAQAKKTMSFRVVAVSKEAGAEWAPLRTP